MSQTLHSAVVVLVALLACRLPALAAEPASAPADGAARMPPTLGSGKKPPVVPPVPDEHLARMRAAVESLNLPRRAGEPRNVLVFSRCRGWWHYSIPYGIEAMRMLARATGALEITVSDDPAIFTPEGLADFDAIVFNNAVGEVFLPDLPGGSEDALPANPAKLTGALRLDAERKAALLAWVRGGGGLVLLHGAAYLFPRWKEFPALLGAAPDGHPWYHSVRVRVDAPDDPLNRGVPPEGLTLTDEVYQFRSPYSRKDLRVLLSLDPASVDLTAKGVSRTDGDFALAWVRREGEGRVFYSALGHHLDLFWTRAVLRHWYNGIVWAGGTEREPSQRK